MGQLNQTINVNTSKRSKAIKRTCASTYATVNTKRGADKEVAKKTNKATKITTPPAIEEDSHSTDASSANEEDQFSSSAGSPCSSSCSSSKT
mmetsp:Transcript_125715/g.177404  ORF Transcript_125715/g.177404 Transcript_125715/m.177404 type:complete len:92 (+) Transcript_125715:540-815(+)